jgi:signal transduction histidine kinase
LRYDDRLATILQHPAQDAGSKAAIWTQVVDLLAQYGDSATSALADRAYGLLAEWRDVVPDRRRLAVAVAIAGQKLPPRLISFFANDAPAVAAPILVRCALSGTHWQSVIQDCPQTARALIRERRDLPEEARRALGAYGISDFALPSGAAMEVVTLQLDLADQALSTPEPMAVPIGELVRRIEAYRERKPLDAVRNAAKAPSAGSFAFETDMDGAFSWIEGVSRGPLIGLSLSEMAIPGGFGVDGRATGAFRKRDAIRDSRLIVAGLSDAAGEWILSAQPFFDSESGRFGGYRGIARRTSPQAEGGEAVAGSGMTPESVRQLIHELRTPLNAIRGFAEMIEGQYLGDVEIPYRKRAEAIIVESGRLLRIFEDLDVSARIAGGEEVGGRAVESDLTRILRTTAMHHSSLAAARSVRLQVTMPPEPAHALVDEASAIRLIDRLLLSVLASAGSGEVIKAVLDSSESWASLNVSRPLALRGIDDARLLDPTFEGGEKAVDDDMPLGLAFVLRLVKRMARQANGRFEIGQDSFTLILPRVSDSAEGTIESS